MISFSLESPPQVHKEFIWLNQDHPYLKELRKRYHLEDKVKDETDDLKKVEKMMSWVNKLWEHDGINEPTKSDPLSILDDVSKGKRFRCVEYAIVLNGCLNALGLYSRVLSLKTRDCETRVSGAGHVVVEVYIPQMKKWIMADPQFNVVPYKGNVPLNAVEFAQCSKNMVVFKETFDEDFSYYDWIKPYLYYFTVNFDNRVSDDRSYKEKEQLMLVPLGAKKPTIFQRIYPIGNLSYTNTLKDFYFEPFKKSIVI